MANTDAASVPPAAQENFRKRLFKGYIRPFGYPEFRR